LEIINKIILGGCHHLLLVFDALKFSTVYVVKSPVVGLLRAPENSVLAPSVLVLYGLCCLRIEIRNRDWVMGRYTFCSLVPHPTGCNTGIWKKVQANSPVHLVQDLKVCT
jgi:hypothetical protein